FVLRFLSVFSSTIGSKLTVNEKLFVSWVGPRGIVAAGIASLFGTKLVSKGVEGAEYITPLVFAVVLVTVLLNAASARFVAKIVGVFLKSSNGIMIVGASKASRLIATYLQNNNRHVVFVDSNRFNIDKAKELGIDAIHGNIYSDKLTDNIELSDVGYLIAMTGNDEVNRKVIERYRSTFGENGAFRLMGSEEHRDDALAHELFSSTHDYVGLTEVARNFPSIQELPIDTKSKFLKLLGYINEEDSAVPLFIKDEKNHIDLIDNPKEMKIAENSYLVYLGKPIDFEDVMNVANEKE